ncbi:alginate lyase family protein [Cerasicoccus fimbriatus]|uniref:alginate lyase family protein n=1 Tax=Cerasicoccus fimbriatus TaxID=3014554 RepID=UPI0022B426B1|nr:alginate lyase family protein [Cerasicoccus sp. TK19100]
MNYRQMIPRMAAACGLIISLMATAQAQSTQPELYNVAEATLGATAKGTNANFNKDWLPQKALENGRQPGTIFSPLNEGTIDIRLVIPVEIEAVSIQGLARGNIGLPKDVDIYIDGKKVGSGAVSDDHKQTVTIPAKGFGQHVKLQFTSKWPPFKDKNGKVGPDWGGVGKISVLSPTNLEAEMIAPKEYQVSNEPAAVQSTIPPKGEVDVFVEVRQTEGHPNTFWDQKDIDAYKEMLKTSEELQMQLAGLKKAMDERMEMPHNVPPPQKDDQGNWRHLAQNERPQHNQNALDIANAGTVYVLTGEEKYGELAKKLLLEYAKAFPNYAPGNRPGFNHDEGKLFDQRLGDATWLIQVARGYDLIYNLPSITPAEREMIENDLLKASAKFIAKNSSVLRAPTNWSAICTLAVLITGYATDDDELVELAMYGPAGKDGKQVQGVMLHFSEKSISPDGLWSEGAMGYQGMAMQALVMYAEILRHHGIDMYSYRDSAMKGLFDSPLQVAYPDLTAPAMNDSGRADIVGRESYLWEYGYRRYRDPKYLTILNQSGRHLDAQFQQFPVSVNYTEVDAEAEAVEWKSVNMFDVGYGILRNTTENGTISVLLDYGPNRSHGHPDKLNVDVYAFNNWLIPDPGIVWYENPLYKDWYKTTMAHNTLAVDELSQMLSDGNQLVYVTGNEISMQRANADKAFSGVTMDRAMFVTPNYMADLFGAFSKLSRKMDLCWHIRGDYSSDLAVSSFAFPEPVNAGYKMLQDVQSADTDESYTMDFAVEGERARFIAAGGADTQVIIGDGILGRETPKTIIQRREVPSTLYGNVVEFDYDGKDFVKSVDIAGSLDDGYGLLTIKTVDGVDYGFAAFQPGMHDVKSLKTDAMQAYVMTDGKQPTAMILGGGKFLSSHGATLQRDTTGLAIIEHAENGAYVVSNPSPGDATLKIDMAALNSLSAYHLDSKGKRDGQAKVEKDGSSLVLKLSANESVEFAKPGAQSLYAFRQDLLEKVRAEQEAIMMKAFNECAARTAERVAASEQDNVPAGTTIAIQAEDMTGQGGGEVGVSSNKKAIVGKAFSGWNADGHWLEYEVDAPADGYYNVSLVYCSQLDGGERAILINGEDQEPFVLPSLPATGGWANGSDDWRLFTVMNPTNEKPLLYKLKKGKNTIKMTNVNGKGVNMDYFLITSPDVEPQRLEPSKASS